jgi:hypothetical protein
MLPIATETAIGLPFAETLSSIGALATDRFSSRGPGR